MSLLIKKVQPRILYQFPRVLNGVQGRQASHWMPDFKPGPYPKTKEEREAAAKKYNLLPEEYEPYHDESENLGDYPNLPFESVDSKDPYYDWDNQELRREFMEPLHRRAKALVPELLSTEPLRVSYLKGSILFLAYVLFGGLTLNYMKKIRIESPATAKQYPKPGVKHYTFEVEW